MLKIKKIKNKEIAKVMSQVDTQPCKYASIVCSIVIQVESHVIMQVRIFKM